MSVAGMKVVNTRFGKPTRKCPGKEIWKPM